MPKKKKYDPVKDIMDITRVNVASTVGVVTINSMPSTPLAPAMEGAKSFAGASFGMLSTMQSSKAVLNSLNAFSEVTKPRKKRK